jgi:membrane-bound inhibitor of C-type lysozyme
MKSVWNTIFRGTAVVSCCLALAACERRPVGKVHVFRCAGGATVKAVFTEKDETMTMYVDKKTYKLKHVPSGSGAKYSDGKVVFWSKGREAYIEINGEVVHDGCTLVAE